MQAAIANETIGNHLSKRPDAAGKWTYKAVATMQEALTDADFVIISIMPKTFDEMAIDVHMPERLGIYQSVGDTAGPGGINRALRTIPMFVTFAQNIKEYCPNAWVINYTNPMSLCVKTLYHVFPEIKAFGCCHEVFGTQDFLASVVQDRLGLTDISRKDIVVNVLGINHFTWFDYASYKGIDIMPLYREFVSQYYDTGYEETHDHWMNSNFSSAQRVKMDLFRHFGLIAAAGDRHLAEFMPGDIYLKNSDTVKTWKFSLTSVDWRKQDLKERLARSQRLVHGEEEIDLTKDTGEEGILLIKALCGLGNVISNVNIPNRGLQISNLPNSAIVETNALFERDTIRPVYAGSLPQNILDLTTPHIENHERILEAAVTHNFNLVVDAFEHDSLVHGRASREEIQALVQEMIQATISDF